MNPEDMKFCQSCGMPMSDEHFASEKDGSKKTDLKAKITVNTAIWMVSLPVTLQWKK